MAGVKEIFEKQGGRKLLRKYWHNGVFFTAVGEFVLLGKSRTALEILRLSVTLKTKEKLAKKYKNKLEVFERTYKELPHERTNKVWVCWFQGMENAPEVVKKCYKSLKENLTDQEIVLITADNMRRYVEFPDFIIEKWKAGSITDTHMTDLLRLELLIRYGGMWVDATVFCTRQREKIPAYYFDSDLFFYQCLKPGRDGHSGYISSWLISAKTNNHILRTVQYLCYEYWREHTELVDYFLLHDFMSIVLDRYPAEWKSIVPADNSTPHILLLRLFEEYDEQIWKSVIEQSPFHKLSYKFEEEQTKMKNTYYAKIVGE